MGRTVFITGASGGIGGAVARAMAQEGHRLVLGCHHNAAAAEALKSELALQGAETVVVQGDVAAEAQVEAMFAAAEAAFGPVEVLVNNAGSPHWGLLTDTDPGQWDAVQSSHARGSFLCCRRAIPAMVRARCGAIVNLSSMWGQAGAACEAAYSAAQAAVIGLTKALARELAPSRVRVNCVAPGAIDTPMLADFSAREKEDICARTPVGRLGRPEEVAAAVRFLASEQAGFITGAVLPVNGGFVM